MNQKATQRISTEQALLSALEAELADGSPLRVETIAARAGVNKALVYRYFGSLDGLVLRFAQHDDFMPGPEELRKLCTRPLERLEPRERFAECVSAYVRALGRRPATVQILLGLASLDAQALAAIAQGRSQAIAAVRDTFQVDPRVVGFDVDVAFNLLVAGACHVLRTHRTTWTELPLAQDEVVGKVTATLTAMLATAPLLPPPPALQKRPRRRTDA